MFGRRYLAIDAVERADDIVAELQGAADALGQSGQSEAAVIAVLDGAPENCRESSRWERENAAAFEEKDARFYECCCNILSLSGGSVLVRPDSPKLSYPPGQRLYQDGCAAVFAQAYEAIAAALRLHRTLADLNERMGLACMERYSTRIAIARRWPRLIPLVRHVWRGETVVHPDLYRAFDASCQEILSAVGVKPARVGVGSLGRAT